MKNPKVKRVARSDSHHYACACMLMDDYKVPRAMKHEVIALVKEVYDQARFPHCLIVMSIGGFRDAHKTLRLKYFLQEHGRRQPTRTKEHMLGSEDYV